MKKICLAILLLFTTQQLLHAQIKQVTLLTTKPQLYKKAEFNIQLIGIWDNPYLQEDVTLDMLLTSPSGKKLILPCYYESGKSGEKSLWKARFAPQETGRYKYTFRFNKAGATVSTSKVGMFTSAPSQLNGFLHPKNNWEFQFDSGKPFRGIGENIGWESRKNDDSKFFKQLHENPKYNYEYMLRSLASHGGNFFRTWVSAFNLPIDWQKGFNSNRYTPSDTYFNPSAIQKMDRMLTLSDSLHIYIMLTLGQGAYNIKDGGFSPTAADFFVNPKSKQRYKNRLRYFIARWGYSTSIGAWELFNEVDNVQFGNKNKTIDADSIVQWHDEMSTYIKQNDPYNHLVTTSISHRDLKGLNSLKSIDLNQKHIYKNNTNIAPTIVSYEQKFGKPYVIGEYGYEWDWSKNFDDFAPQMDSDFKRGLWYGLFSPTPILPMSWWWEYFDNRHTDAYIIRVRTILNRMLAAGKGSFTKVDVNSSQADVQVFSVKCGNETYVYTYNPGTEAKKFDLEFALNAQPQQQLTVYNCETGKYTRQAMGKPAAGKLKLVNQTIAANSDAVYIVSAAK